VPLDDVEPAELAQRCLRRGVAVVPGSAFYPEDEQGISALRLNFTHLEEERLRDAAGVILEESLAGSKERTT
jgi:DNA-binding transcriptional MocR family regulator